MIRLLTQPSSYRANPAGYALNQIGHAGLGALWVWLGLPLWAWVLAYAAWEAVQLLAFGAGLADGLEDAAFASAGAAAALLGWIVVIPLALFLSVGIVTRMIERKEAQHARH